MHVKEVPKCAFENTSQMQNSAKMCVKKCTKICVNKSLPSKKGMPKKGQNLDLKNVLLKNCSKMCIKKALFQCDFTF